MLVEKTSNELTFSSLICYLILNYEPKEKKLKEFNNSLEYIRRTGVAITHSFIAIKKDYHFTDNLTKKLQFIIVFYL